MSTYVIYFIVLLIVQYLDAFIIQHGEQLYVENLLPKQFHDNCTEDLSSFYYPGEIFTFIEFVVSKCNLYTMVRLNSTIHGVVTVPFAKKECTKVECSAFRQQYAYTTAQPDKYKLTSYSIGDIIVAKDLVEIRNNTNCERYYSDHVLYPGEMVYFIGLLPLYCEKYLIMVRNSRTGIIMVPFAPESCDGSTACSYFASVKLTARTERIPWSQRKTRHFSMNLVILVLMAFAFSCCMCMLGVIIVSRQRQEYIQPVQSNPVDYEMVSTEQENIKLSNDVQPLNDSKDDTKETVEETVEERKI